ncbi:hypothetical protein D9M72_562590 [compost metagenome]
MPSSLFIVWVGAASTGTVAVINTLVQRIANEFLRNMQTPFLMIMRTEKTWAHVMPAAQRLPVPASRGAGLGMNVGGLAGALRSG